MKKVIRGAAIICLLLPLTACRFRYMNPEDVSGFLENLSGIVGSFQITSDHDLIGERGCGEDDLRRCVAGGTEALCLRLCECPFRQGGDKNPYERRCDGAGTR